MHVGQTELAALVLVGQSRVIDPQGVQDRRLQVVDMHRRLEDVVAKRIGLAVHLSASDPAAGHPNSEAAGVVIAPKAVGRQLALAVIGTAELAAPNYERVLEHVTLLEI